MSAPSIDTKKDHDHEADAASAVDQDEIQLVKLLRRSWEGPCGA